MKKLTIIAAMLLGSIGTTFSGQGEPVKTITVDSSKSEITFEVEASKEQILNVSVQGVQEDFTSIALIDQRGKSIFYSFVKSEDETFEINLNELKPGKYYVKLNMDSEIRMKTLIVQG